MSFVEHAMTGQQKHSLNRWQKPPKSQQTAAENPSPDPHAVPSAIKEEQAAPCGAEVLCSALSVHRTETVLLLVLLDVIAGV